VDWFNRRRLLEPLGYLPPVEFEAAYYRSQENPAIPAYDITFSPSAEPHMRRTRRDKFNDFMQLRPSDPGPLVFLGGESYRELFTNLVGSVKIEKVVFLRCEPMQTGIQRGRNGDWTSIPFPTTRRTNWHYECAAALCRDPAIIQGAR
jgi:hypothetical protein